MDEVNRKIISKLQEDGRTSFKKLAEITGYTSMGVKKRFNNLQENGLVHVSASIDLKSLKLSAVILMLEMENMEAMNELAERFKDCPRVVHLFNTLGGYNLVALLVVEDPSTMQSISLEKCSLRTVKGIRRSEFLPIGDIYFSSFLPIRYSLAHRNLEITPCNVDCRECNRYKNEKCVGCPATNCYRGQL